VKNFGPVKFDLISNFRKIFLTGIRLSPVGLGCKFGIVMQRIYENYGSANPFEIRLLHCEYLLVEIVLPIVDVTARSSPRSMSFRVEFVPTLKTDLVALCVYFFQWYQSISRCHDGVRMHDYSSTSVISGLYYSKYIGCTVNNYF
jgi:hypothetical protein